MSNILLVTNHLAEGAIAVNRIVKFGATDRGILQASAPTDFMLGTCMDSSAATGERQDVARAGVGWVEAGGLGRLEIFVVKDLFCWTSALISGSRVLIYLVVGTLFSINQRTK